MVTAQHSHPVLDSHIPASQTSASSLKPVCLSQAVDEPKRHENQDCFYLLSTSVRTTDTCHLYDAAIHPSINAVRWPTSRKLHSYCVGSQLLHTWVATFAWGLDSACSGFGTFHVAPGNNCCHEQILFYTLLFFLVCLQTVVHPRLHRPQDTKLTAAATTDSKAVRWGQVWKRRLPLRLWRCAMNKYIKQKREESGSGL